MHENAKLLRGALVAAVLLAVCAVPAGAQGSEKFVDAGTGLGVSGTIAWTSPGVGIDFAKPIATVWNLRTINVVGELTVYRGVTNVAGGLRYVRHNTINRPVLFAQFLGGLTHEREVDGRNDFFVMPGGGAVFALSGTRVFLRAQNDYVVILRETKTKVFLRFSVGVEIHLK